MSLQAVPARPHDLKDALALLGRSQLTEQDVAEHWGHYFVVREDDGRVVGVAGLEVHGAFGLLRSVAVDEDYRRQGLAAGLVTAVVERARHLRMADLYLLTTDARGYFERHGFRECPRQEAPPAIRASWEFGSGCPQTAILMKRPVG
ncbi:MAG TPA: arsenic resistance N-acetyltransferase ArsN2 [Vicinamibacteria bacterium]|nr:arsenic resistance N-acetyltransferase ArsN2 [Vicinamibacteria bacterium]